VLLPHLTRRPAPDQLKKEADGTYAGELEAALAKALFAVLGRRAAAAPEAKGTVKFWVKDGQLAKFEHVVRGKITVGEDKKEVEISRTLTVEIKDAGSTKISLPETAMKKLCDEEALISLRRRRFSARCNLPGRPFRGRVRGRFA